ncbi:MAG: nucleotidyl transferase AbiEii/AbiGii toxin family protein, partial [Acidobacteriota bacterium]
LRTALEARLLERAKRDNTDLQRLRRQVAFDRLLARLFSTDAAVRGWVLKGGYALELRFRQARTTRDLDLTITSGGINDGSVPSATAQPPRAIRVDSLAGLVRLRGRRRNAGT